MALRKNTRAGLGRRRSHGLIGMGLLSLSILAGAFMLRGGTPAAAPEPPTSALWETVEVPVPTDFVPAGTRISQIRFKHLGFPRDQLPRGAIRDLSPYMEAVVVAPLPANLPLFRENLSHSARGSNPVIERIPTGMRAITIQVDATSAVEGWAGSGSVVDVLLVEETRSTVVAEQVKVLSTERTVAQHEGEAAPAVPSTVTLLVTQEQALAINTAVPRGRIAFALRSFDDDERWLDRVYTAERLKGPSAVKRNKSKIKGYISIKGENGQQAFALADGKWIRSRILPEGFFAMGQERHEEN
ncbi:MAG: Flp pilus assembly protein CpaB [Deltaproteobacteria bacterium]|nr:Flp pilus assembly protein CpaB [Deltaproteobacteria bacterium]